MLVARLSHDPPPAHPPPLGQPTPLAGRRDGGCHVSRRNVKLSARPLSVGKLRHPASEIAWLYQDAVEGERVATHKNVKQFWRRVAARYAKKLERP